MDVQGTSVGTSRTRFEVLIVAAVAYVCNLGLLLGLIEVLSAGKIVSQAVAIALVTPLNFIGNKLWSFRR